METPTDTQIAPPVIPKRLVRFVRNYRKTNLFMYDRKKWLIRTQRLEIFVQITLFFLVSAEMFVCHFLQTNGTILTFSDLIFRFTKLILSDCHKSTFQVLDSCVLSGQQIVLVNCTDLTLMVDCIDIRYSAASCWFLPLLVISLVLIARTSPFNFQILKRSLII